MNAALHLFKMLEMPLVLAFLLSFGVSLGLVLTKHLHSRFSTDLSVGKQKVHDAPTPRIGGLAVALGFAIFLIGLRFVNFSTGYGFLDLLSEILLAAVPAFLAGFVEDITKKVGVLTRLAATAVSGCLLVLLTGHWVSHVSIPGIDLLLSFLPIGLLFTAVAVAGIANSVNIIDGFNGLASGVVILMLTTLGFIAYNVGDMAVMLCAALGAVITFGFMVVNFPRGYIFLGDAGAYSLGFYVAALAVLLAERNPSTVSPWAMLLVCGYPIIETLFSIYRRTFRKRRLSPGQPDALHLHSLAYKNLISRRLFPRLPAWKRNALTSPFMWAYASVPMLGAVNWPESVAMVMLWLLFSTVVYLQLYRKLLRLRVKAAKPALVG